VDPYVETDPPTSISSPKLLFVMWNPWMALKCVHMPPSSGATLVELGDK